MCTLIKEMKNGMYANNKFKIYGLMSMQDSGNVGCDTSIISRSNLMKITFELLRTLPSFLMSYYTLGRIVEVKLLLQSIEVL